MSEQLRVLILDDDVSVALSIQVFLEDEHFDARDTTVVEDFEKLVTEESWDAVIIDAFLPDQRERGLWGLELARWVRTQSRNVAILLMSGWVSSKAEIERCAAEIGADVVWKPIKSEELLTKLHNLIGSKSHD